VAVNAPREGRFPFKPGSAIEAAQTHRVRSVVSHAYRYVPYYRETMRRLGLRPGDFESGNDLSKLPLIERDQLQRDPAYFVSTASPIESYVELHTGGSGGAPVTIFRHPFAFFRYAVHRERARRVTLMLTGRRLRYREAAIVFQPGRSAFDQRTLLPARLRVERKLFSILVPPSESVGGLNEFRPHVIASHGSYLEALFAHLHATGRPFHRPAVALYGSDPVSGAMRRLIWDAYGIHVLSRYGAAETPHVGFECERHLGLHVNVDFCPVRIVDPEGRQLPDGESGEVIASNLIGHGTILLNYRLGDLAAALPEPCPCGRSLPMLSFPEGRSDDWLESASGRPMHPHAATQLLKAEKDVLRYQVVQEARGRFHIAIVTAPARDEEALRQRLTRKFVRRFGDGTAVRISFVDSLPRTSSGKVRPIVRLNASQPAAR
jgi:phenylacetate-CoA ligase